METSPGRFERPFDSIERFLLSLARASSALNREHWSVTVFARFHMKAAVQDTESVLRHAWKTMRYDHPQLASVAEGDTKIYEVPDSAALDAWLNDTFIVTPTSATKEELLASIRPSALATLYFLPHTSEIVIHTSHWRIDLIGAFSLLQNLFDAMVHPRRVEFGDEGKNLSPSRDEAAKYCSTESLESPAVVQERQKGATDLVMQLLNNLPSIGLPAHHINQTPSGTRRAAVVLDTQTTSAVVFGCQKRGFTVTTALHAALITALQEATPVALSSDSKYTAWGIFSVRRLLETPWSSSARHPAAVYILGLPLSLHASTYENLALQLKRFYKQRLPPSRNSDLRGDIIVPYTRHMADLAGQPPPAELPVASEPILSSGGIVDDYLQHDFGETLQVEDFWIGVEMMTAQVVCYLWTWQGKMTLSACYNERYYDLGFIQNFLERIISILHTELAIRVN